MKVFIRFDTVPALDGQTDGQTESIKQYRALYMHCMMTRDEN